jgi:hypothetical protein
MLCPKCGQATDDMSGHDCSAVVANKRTKTADFPDKKHKVFSITPS